MSQAPLAMPLRARLITDLPIDLAAADVRAATRVYRPLVIGAAVLRRTATSWQVPVSADGRLRPLRPRSGPSGPGPSPARRVALALLAPQDMTPGAGRAARARRVTAASERRSDIYGWALLYQPRGLRGMALVDRHEEFDDLPACYEWPLEMLDRADFLAARGIPTRPLLVVTQRQDFVVDPAGRLCNRFRPQALCDLPGDLDWFA